MKKILLSFLAIAALMFVSCGNAQKGENEKDSVSDTITPADVANPNQKGGEQTVVGVAIDGAMNSIEILTLKGDTVNYAYPELDQSKRASWSIGDTVTIKYVKLAGANPTDSVTAVLKGKQP